MNRIQKFITRLNTIFLVFILFFYSYIRIINTFLRDYPKGDENSFLPIFKMFIEKGYYETVAYGNSILFNIFSFFIYKLSGNEILSLKFTSLIFGFLTIASIYILQKKYLIDLPQNYKNISFLTSINILVVSSIVFVGINDMMLSFFTTLFFILLFKVKENKDFSTTNFMKFGLLISFMVLTRMMSFVFILPLLILLIILLFQKKMKLKKAMSKLAITVVTAFAIVVIFNMPSIIEKNKLSFHDKSLQTSHINWTQLQYLSEIGYEKGELKYAQHYSIKEVEKYVLENGEDSLPKTLVSSLFFDISRTIKIFFREILFLTKPFFRLLGLIFIINILMFFYYFYKNRIKLKNFKNEYVLIFSLIYICFIALIVSSYIEPRWFLNFLILLPIVFMEKIYNFKIENKLGNRFDFIVLNTQILSLIIMNLPYIYKNFKILF